MRSLGSPDIVQQQLRCDCVDGQRDRKGLRDHHRKHTCRQLSVLSTCLRCFALQVGGCSGSTSRCGEGLKAGCWHSFVNKNDGKLSVLQQRQWISIMQCSFTVQRSSPTIKMMWKHMVEYPAMPCHCTVGQRTDPDSEEGDGDEDGGGDGANGVGPAAGAVHEAVEEAQLPLEQRRAPGVQDDLEVALHAILWPLREVSQQGHRSTATCITCLVVSKWTCRQSPPALSGATVGP